MTTPVLQQSSKIATVESSEKSSSGIDRFSEALLELTVDVTSAVAAKLTPLKLSKEKTRTNKIRFIGKVN